MINFTSISILERSSTYRIRFKLLLQVYQCVQQTAPTYLCELLHEKKKSKYGIRSYELDHLHIPDSGTKTYGDRAFCFSGPREWNKLSLERRQSKSVEVFKTKLKTLLFKDYYIIVLKKQSF